MSKWAIKRATPMGCLPILSYYAPRCYLLDADEHLVMMHALDFKFPPTRLDFYSVYRYAGLVKYNKDGEAVSGIPYEQLNREYEAKRDAAFDWQGDFTIERLLERVSQDAERIRKARNTAEALPR